MHTGMKVMLFVAGLYALAIGATVWIMGAP